MKPQAAIAINSMFSKVDSAKLRASEYLYRAYINPRVKEELIAFHLDLRALLRRHNKLWKEAEGFLKPKRIER